MTKKELRKDIKKILQEHEKEFSAESERICTEILASESYKKSQIIFAYMALFDEVNISRMILKAQSEGKRVFIPKVEVLPTTAIPSQNYFSAKKTSSAPSKENPATATDSNMDFFELKKETKLFSGSFGILEPILDENKFTFSDEFSATKKNLQTQSEKACKNPQKTKSLILVPGRAFTKDGLRLGRGKGYYDTFLSKIPKDFDCTVAGVCFPFQIVEFIPTEIHDIKMQTIFY